MSPVPSHKVTNGWAQAHPNLPPGHLQSQSIPSGSTSWRLSSDRLSPLCLPPSQASDQQVPKASPPADLELSHHLARSHHQLVAVCLSPCFRPCCPRPSPAPPLLSPEHMACSVYCLRFNLILPMGMSAPWEQCSLLSPFMPPSYNSIREGAGAGREASRGAAVLMERVGVLTQGPRRAPWRRCDSVEWAWLCMLSDLHQQRLKKDASPPC